MQYEDYSHRLRSVYSLASKLIDLVTSWLWTFSGMWHFVNCGCTVPL